MNIDLFTEPLEIRRPGGPVLAELNIIDAELRIEKIEAASNDDADMIISGIKQWLKQDKNLDLDSSEAWIVYHGVRGAYLEFKKKADAMLVSPHSTASIPGRGRMATWLSMKTIFHPWRRNGNCSRGVARDY